MDQASSLRQLVDTRAKQIRKELSAAACKPAPAQGSLPRVIAVTSGKGGVGKTNIVVNLALALSGLSQKVLVLDADLGLANIDIIFGLYPKFNIGHVLSGEKELREIMVEGPRGIRIVPAGSGFADLTHLTEGQKLGLLNEFESLDEEFDVFLIDTGAGISDNVLYFNLAADECIVVATPEPTSITDAYAMIKVMSTQHGAKSFKLLVNMAQDDREAKNVYAALCQAVDRFLANVVIEYLGFIPFDHKVQTAVRNRKAFWELFPEAASSKHVGRIATAILDSPRRGDADGNLKFFFKRFIDYKFNHPG